MGLLSRLGVVREGWEGTHLAMGIGFREGELILSQTVAKLNREFIKKGC